LNTPRYSVTKVNGVEVPFDPSQLRRIQEHPCFSEKACHLFGRMHLAVAPKCNIQCNYCVRDFDCVNESRPGVCSRIISPEEAVGYISKAIREFPYIKVIAIAGPGEPLYNDETFKTLELTKESFPHLLRCLSTNGLLLPEKIDLLESWGGCIPHENKIEKIVSVMVYKIRGGKKWKYSPFLCFSCSANASAHRSRFLNLSWKIILIVVLFLSSSF
jgi:nitrogen fixation protein NifB